MRMLSGSSSRWGAQPCRSIAASVPQGVWVSPGSEAGRARCLLASVRSVSVKLQACSTSTGRQVLRQGPDRHGAVRDRSDCAPASSDPRFLACDPVRRTQVRKRTDGVRRRRSEPSPWRWDSPRGAGASRREARRPRRSGARRAGGRVVRGTRGCCSLRVTASAGEAMRAASSRPNDHCSTAGSSWPKNVSASATAWSTAPGPPARARRGSRARRHRASRSRRPSACRQRGSARAQARRPFSPSPNGGARRCGPRRFQ